MRKSTTNMLMLGGAVALAWYLLRKQSALKGLGDADPAKLDISGNEDLCRAVQNLIALETHLEGSAVTTNKRGYLDALGRVRELRRKAMAKLLPEDAEAEVWCCFKHLAGSAMQLSEAGHKKLADGDADGAQQLFEMAAETKQAALAMASGAKAGGQCPVCRGG